MSSIAPEFNEQISKEPGTQYAVLITLKDEALPSDLENKGKFIMGNKIFSAKISGREIQNLANDSQIEAIEPDVEMGIL